MISIIATSASNRRARSRFQTAKSRCLARPGGAVSKIFHKMVQRRMILLSFGAILLACLSTISAQAQQAESVVMSSAASSRALSKGEVSLDAAIKIVKGCQEFAAKNSFVAASYVLDPFGNIVFAQRMDGIRPLES